MASVELNELPRTKAKTKSEVTLTPSKTPVGLEQELQRLIRYMMKQMRKRFENKVLKEMNKTTQAKFQDAQIGNFGDIFDSLSADYERSILKQFSKERFDKFIKKLYRNTNKMNKRVFNSSVNNKLGIDLGQVIKSDGLDEFTNAAISQSVSQITKVRDEAMTNVKQDVFRLMQNGASMTELYNQVRKTTSKNLKRGDLNARNELKNFNSILAKKRQENAGIEWYQWQTSEDERVRSSHEVLNGKICKWNDPTVYADNIEDANNGKWKKRSSIGAVELDVGIDINCRCVGLGVVNDL